MKKRTWSPMVFLLALCLVLTACSSSNDAEIAPITAPDPIVVAENESSTPEIEVAASEKAPSIASIDTEPSDSELPVEVEVTVDTDTGIDVGVDLIPEGIFAGATVALQALDSYRFTTSFLFTGQEDGEIESGSIELSGEIMGAERKHFIWKNLEDNEQFEIIQLEDEAWVYSDEEWEAVPTLVADAMSQGFLVFAPSVVWDGLFGGLESESTYVGSETVDGIPVHHYTSTYQQWAGIWEGEVLDATGDVWIAEAGYPVRYDFTATAVDENGDRGTVTWSMRLTDAGGEIIIEPPVVETPNSSGNSSQASIPAPSTSAGPSSTETSRSESANDMSKAISSNGYYGCVDRAKFDELMRYITQGDQAAFSNALAQSIAHGESTLFEAGERVFVMDTKIFSGMVRIRREGETTSYWTVLEALD